MTDKEAIELLRKMKVYYFNDWSAEGNELKLALITAINKLEHYSKQKIKGKVIEKLEGAFHDMDAHYHNNYKDDSEYLMRFTVGELKWLLEDLKND